MGNRNSIDLQVLTPSQFCLHDVAPALKDRAQRTDSECARACACEQAGVRGGGLPGEECRTFSPTGRPVRNLPGESGDTKFCSRQYSHMCTAIDAGLFCSPKPPSLLRDITTTKMVHTTRLILFFCLHAQLHCVKWSQRWFMLRPQRLCFPCT